MILYTDIDPKICAWLSELVRRGLLPNGDVVCADIRKLKPETIAGYHQCHFFAGIGGWPLALQMAGWPADRPVWTGSCPCQPFSVAGRQKGENDERHLWPAFRELITECKPATVFGEQVASNLGRQWLARVRADLETLGYAVGAADLCAASVGAPHIRQRLYWVAHAGYAFRRGSAACGETHGGGACRAIAGSGEVGSCAGRLANAASERELRERSGQASIRTSQNQKSVFIGALGNGMGNAKCAGLEGHAGHGTVGDEPGRLCSKTDGSTAAPSTQWSNNYAWLKCRDGKSRRVKPGVRLLAHGIPARMVRLCGYGNAIVPQVAAAFVKSFLECDNSENRNK